MISETSRIRDRVQKYCVGNGLDVGFGGDSVCSTAINIDQSNQYTNLGSDPKHLTGDASDLYWFNNRTLDYIYSSHLIEDFKNPLAVLLNWWSKIKLHGRLIIYAPEEIKYRNYCKLHNQPPNAAHKRIEFGKDYLVNRLPFSNYKIIECVDVEPYSFLLVLEKVE